LAYVSRATRANACLRYTWPWPGLAYRDHVALPEAQDGERSVRFMTLFVGQSRAPKIIFEYLPQWSDARIVVVNDSLGIVENEIPIVTVNETE